MPVVLRKLNVDEIESAFGPLTDFIQGHEIMPVGIEGFPECLPMIGRGASKKVFDLGDGTVLKVHAPMHERRFEELGNQVERECINWRNAAPPLSRYLAPILTHADDYTWAIQAKADQSIRPTVRTVNEIERATGDEDVKTHNIGKINGRWVLLDYGYRELDK